MEVVAGVLPFYFWEFEDVAHDLRVSKGTTSVADVVVDTINFFLGLFRDSQQ